MAYDRIDVTRILSFRLKDAMRGYTGTGFLFATLGAFVLIVPDADQQDWKSILAGAGVLAVGLAMILVPRLKLKRNEDVVAEISPAGIMMSIQNSTRRSFRVPWNEVIEITQISFIRPVVTTFATYVREPAITVSHDFYAREIDVDKSGRGLFWHHHVHVRADGRAVHLVLLHHEFDMSRRQLRAELDARWRVFGMQPEAKKPVIAAGDPLALIERLWESATATKGRTMTLKVVALLVALTAIYFWHYAFTYIGMARLQIGQIESYAGDLLRAGRLPGRIDGGRITMLPPSAAASVRSGSCERSIKRDNANTVLVPRYMQHHACRVTLNAAYGKQVEAAFDVVVAYYEQTTGYDMKRGVETTKMLRVLTAAAPSANDIRMRLCPDGGC